MPITHGKVEYVKVRLDAEEDECFTMITKHDGSVEWFIVWEFEHTVSHPTAYERVTHSMWLSMLRDAFTHDLTVSVTTPSETSSRIVEVVMHR